MVFSSLSTFDPSQFSLVQQMPQSLLSVSVSAFATCILIGGYALGQRKLRHGTRTNPVENPSSENCDFEIIGSNLRAITDPARVMLDSIGVRKTRLAAIKSHLAADCPTIASDIQRLIVEGARFRHFCARKNGTAIEILGEPRGNSAFLSIRPAGEDAIALRAAEKSLEAARSENQFLREILDCSPVMAWSKAPDDTVSWANEVYRANFDSGREDGPDHRIPNAFGHVLEEVPLTPRGSENRRRVAVTTRLDEDPHWYEVVQCDGANGETYGYAIEADELVGAEKSLRRFVETLTETFAHLPIGLAVFDKNRRLGLFNPALTELVKIDAVWLAGRPSLRDFLERLRETRQMPEQKDFAEWRRMLSHLEEGARDGTYEENWVLPSGKVFRVTGRPHPQGALAFLFEDISTSIMLERKYRSELELNQATLDHLNEAVAVFDASGSLSIVNSAFEKLWDVEQTTRLRGPAISDMTAIWSEKCETSPVWAKVTEFATGGDVRTSWAGDVKTLDGRNLQVFLAPMPDASSLVLFREVAAATDAVDVPSTEGSVQILNDLAIGEIRYPVQAALEQVMSAIPSAQNAEAYKCLNAAVRDLKGGLERSQKILDLAQSGNFSGSDPLPPLRQAIEARGLTLELSKDWVGIDPQLRGVALLTGLAAAGMATEGSTVELSALPVEGNAVWKVRAATSTSSTADEPSGPGISLCRRMVETAGGSVTMHTGGGSFTVEASVPLREKGGDTTKLIPPLSA